MKRIVIALVALVLVSTSTPSFAYNSTLNDIGQALNYVLTVTDNIQSSSRNRDTQERMNKDSQITQQQRQDEYELSRQRELLRIEQQRLEIMRKQWELQQQMAGQ